MRCNAYAVVVSFISLIIIAITLLIIQEENTIRQEQNSTYNISANSVSIITKIRCVNCMQYQDAERQACIIECARQLK